MGVVSTIIGGLTVIYLHDYLPKPAILCILIGAFVVALIWCLYHFCVLGKLTVSEIDLGGVNGGKIRLGLFEFGVDAVNERIAHHYGVISGYISGGYHAVSVLVYEVGGAISDGWGAMVNWLFPEANVGLTEKLISGEDGDDWNRYLGLPHSGEQKLGESAGFELAYFGSGKISLDDADADGDTDRPEGGEGGHRQHHL